MIWQEQWNRKKGGINNKEREKGINEDSGKRKFNKENEEEIS
jgi:hypothetical protein